MPHARFVALGVSVVVAVAAGRICAADSLPSHVAEYLKAHCGACHGADKAKAGCPVSRALGAIEVSLNARLG